MKSVAVVAMDIHKKFSKAVVMDPQGDLLGEEIIYHDDKECMREFFREFPEGSQVVMEATFNWPWIAELVEQAGHKAHLVDSMRAREMAKGMAKSDRKDAIFLGKLYLSSKIFPEVYLAPEAVRYMRSLFRQRRLLVKFRTAMKNALHGQLFRLGLVVEQLSRADRLEMPQEERRLVCQKLEVIDYLDEEIEALEERIHDALKADPRAEILMSMPGVGQLTAYGILAEMGDVERFANGRALAAYAGLLPLEDSSGGKSNPKRTGQRCNKYLRWALIEAVTGAVRSSGRMRSLHARVAARNRGRAGKARVAVARQLAELAWLLLKREEEYKEDRGALSEPNRVSQTALCAG